MCKVCEGEVQEEKNDQSDEVKERRSVSCRQNEFAESEKRVEGMPRDLVSINNIIPSSASDMYR